MKPEVIPAIMPEDFDDLEEKVSRVVGLVKSVQLDIMDGKFVPERTWPYRNNHGELDNIISEAEAMPFWDQINYEVDLMVSDIETAGYNWIKAGASRIIFHIESSPNILELIKKIKSEFGDSKISLASPEIGVAIDNATDLGELEKYLSDVDFVQMMGIDKIGFQGEPMSQKIIPRITEFRKKHPETIISIDGAVSSDSAKALIEAGVNRLVSGSFIFNFGDIKEAISILKN